MFTKHTSLKTKNNHGIADPITLFGILFLVATLGITTYLATDKDSRLDIGSRAKAVLEGEDYNYLRANRAELDTQIKEKKAEKASQEEKDARQERTQATAAPKVNTCNVDGTSYNNGAVAVSGGVGSYKKCNNGSWEDCPSCTITQLTTVPVYLQEEYNKALQDVAEQLEAEEMSISGTDVIQEQKEQQDKAITEIGSQIIQNQAGQNTTISIGKSVCAGDDKQVWNGDSWDISSCQYGCSNGVCKTKPNENSNVYESVHTGSGSLSTNDCPASSTWVDNTCVANQFVSNEQDKPSASELWNNFQNQYNTALNNSDLQGLGTYGLGSTSPVVTPPLNVLTSNDPNALDEFNKGALYSGVAGFGTAALTTYLAGGAPLAQFASANINATISTLPTAAQSAITYGGGALTVGGTAYSSYDCVVNGPESPTCMGFIAGYQADPIDFVQTLEYSADNLANGAISLVKSSPASNLPDFNLNVTQIKLEKFEQSSPELTTITQISPREIEIKTPGQYLSINLDDPELNAIVNKANFRLSQTTSDEEYWNTLYQIKSEFGTDQFSSSATANTYDLLHTQAIIDNKPVPLSTILKNEMGVCIELSCLLSIITQSGAPKTLVTDIYIPVNGFDIGHATNAALSKDPIIRLLDFNPVFSEQNIGAIQRIDFWGQ